MTDQTDRDRRDPGIAIAAWWRAYLGQPTGAARGLAARLRRGRGAELLSEPAAMALAQRLRTKDAARLIMLLRVLAELRGNGARNLAYLLGGKDPVLSPARYQRMMRAQGDDLTQSLIRAIRMLKSESRACNIANLGRDLWLWDDTTRARWSFDYFHDPIPDPIMTEQA